MNTIRAAVLVALAVTGVTCNDLRVGANYGRIVFNETIQASPAIWRQSQRVTINVTDYEVISRVDVTDQRPEKDGEAKIVEGGEGQQNVTIELKSPTVFRGFDFHVIVYADGIVHPGVDVQHPAIIAKDIDLNSSAKPGNADVVTQATETPVTNEGNTTPALEEMPRKSRNTAQPDPIDPIVKFVTENVSNVDQSTTEADLEKQTKVVTIAKDLKLDTVVPPELQFTTENNAQEVFSTTVPSKDLDVVTISTTTGDVISFTTEKTHENMVQSNYDSISKELGQHVVFGIRRH